LGITPFWIVVALNIALMMGVLSRMISSSALITAIPEPNERGSFMSVNSSVQQLSGGIASVIGGLIIVQSASGSLEHYNTIGYIVAGTILLSILILRYINRYAIQRAKVSDISFVAEDKKLLIADEVQIETNI
jgi:MFS family permease